jgi:hypothetical protein
VSNRGRLSAPGDLGSRQGSLSGPGTATATAPAIEAAKLDLAGAGIPAGERLADYAARYKLEPASAGAGPRT